MEIIETHWLTISIVAIAIAIGGLIGAFLQATIAKAKNVKPAISRRIDVFDIFEDPIGTTRSRQQISLSDGEKNYQYDSLQIVQVQISNQGIQDFEKFQFSINLSEDDVALYIEAKSPDPDHRVEQITTITFNQPKSKLDFIVSPLNRGDAYYLRFFIVTPDGKNQPGKIELSSPEAIRFVNLPTLAEIVQDTASRAAISLGPFQVSFK